MIVIPSIVAEEFHEVESMLKAAEAFPGCEWVHIDIVDGRFAKSKTWPYTQEDIDSAIKDLSNTRTSLKVGVHLMVRYPGDQLDEWIDGPVARVTIHDEILKGVDNFLAILDMSSCESAVALKFETEVDELEDVVDEVDCVQLMSIDEIGGYGEKFNPGVFDKIADVKERWPDKCLIVDGGVNGNNIKSLRDAGVDVVVVGSAIWDNDSPKGAYEKLSKLA